MLCQGLVRIDTLISHDMLQIFEPSLGPIEKLMVNQVIAAWTADVDVEKVLLMGGFADNPALRVRLTNKLVQMRREHRRTIELVVSE